MLQVFVTTTVGTKLKYNQYLNSTIIYVVVWYEKYPECLIVNN